MELVLRNLFVRILPRTLHSSIRIILLEQLFVYCGFFGKNSKNRKKMIDFCFRE